MNHLDVILRLQQNGEKMSHSIENVRWRLRIIMLREVFYKIVLY